MPDNCSTCGAPLKAGAKFCRNCGVPAVSSGPPAVAVPGFSCPACAAHNPYGATHCQSCGRPLPRTAPSNTAFPGASCIGCGAPNAPENRQCTTCGRPLPADRSTIARPESRPSRGKPLILTATALVLAVAMILGLWKPGYLWMIMDEAALPSIGGKSSSGKATQSVTLPKPDIKITESEIKRAKPETASVSSENSSVSAGGATVNFGEYNLIGEETLAVRKLDKKIDKKLGCSAQPYDLSLGDVTEFASLVAVTLPYDDCPDPEARIAVQYYNLKTKEWEHMPFTLDTAGRTVTFKTDHFSTFAVFDMFEFDGEYAGPMTKAVYIQSKLMEMCMAMDTGLFEQMLSQKQIPWTESTYAVLGTANNFTSASNHSINGKQALSAFTGESVARLGKGLGYLGIGLTTLKVGFSWYNSGSLSQSVSDNAYDLAEMAAGLGAMAVGGVFLNVAAAGIWAYGFADATIMDFITSGFENNIEDAFNLFSTTSVTYVAAENRCSFKIKPTDLKSANAYSYWQASEFKLGTMAEWNIALKKIYNRHKDDPTQLNKAINQLLDDYTTVFWRIPESTRTQYIKDSPASSWYSSNATPDEKTQQLYSRRLRARTLQKLEPLFKAYAELAIHDAQQAAIRAVLDAQDTLNQVLSFEISVTDENAKRVDFYKSAYKDYTIVFDNANSTLSDIWRCASVKGSDTVFECTLFAYLTAGSPTKLKFYKTEAEFKGGSAPEFEAEFKTDIPVTTISLEGGLRFEDILGSWNMTQKVSGFGSDYLNQIVGQMEGVPGMADYLSQYQQYMGAVDGTYSGSMVITRAEAGKEIAQVQFVHDSSAQYGGEVRYRGIWSHEGTLKLTPDSTMLAGDWTLTFKKVGAQLICEGTSDYKSDMASYSFTLTATKQP